MSRGSLLALTVLGATLAGCGSISMHTVDREEQILDRRHETVNASYARVEARIDGSMLLVRAEKGCDVVAVERVRIVEIRESNEDPSEELTVLGLMSAPLTSGIVMLIDADNVYEDDRNSRQYNPVGPTGAYVGGGVLVGVGALIATIPIVELLRSASAYEEQASEEMRRGEVVQKNVACEGAPRPLRTSVSLRIGSSQVVHYTDASGHLQLDLARAITPAMARRGLEVIIRVANQDVGRVDIELIRRRHAEIREQLDETSWQQADPEGCRRAPLDQEAPCRGVRRYLQRFPRGLYAEDAARILQTRRDLKMASQAPAKQATDPKEAAAMKRAREAAQRACEAACGKACIGRDAACRDRCIEGGCR